MLRKTESQAATAYSLEWGGSSGEAAAVDPVLGLWVHDLKGKCNSPVRGCGDGGSVRLAASRGSL